MGVIAWLVLGLIAGFIASRIVDHHGLGLVRDIFLGVLGAVVGGALFHLGTGYRIEHVNMGSVLVASAGAILVLAIWHVLTGRRRTLFSR
jgi:uncharacterized membrane protein YeaQ/YmgE (transglycosylase-associated protein family)